MLRDPHTRRWRRRRILVLAVAVFAVGATLSVYIGYRVMFRKNPEVMREIRAADERQQALDDVFAEPATPAVAPDGAHAPPR